MFKRTILKVLCFLLIAQINGAKILGFFFVPSISHSNIYKPIWRQLSLRGHQVTVMSPNIINDTTLTNLTEIEMGFSYETLAKCDLQTNLNEKNFLLQNFLVLHNWVFSTIKEQLEYKAVRDLMQAENDFDLILVEGFHPIPFAFGARYKAPIVAVASTEIFGHIHDIFGNPTHPVLYQDLIMNFRGELTFTERVSAFIFSIVSRIYYYWWILPRSDELARKHFGKDMPFLGEIVQNATLMLKNNNPIMHIPRPNVPGMIEIGQIHIGDKKPLPKDLQEFLDASTEGVVYFSLGTNIKSVNLSIGRREIIKQALSELPYNVIWKWEEDVLPGKPDNVLIKKWLPQQDILGHHNLKVFVTQGGHQSVEEAIVNGVPMVGIPFYIDQPVNVKILVEKGMAIHLNHETMTKDDLKHAILEVATNTRYKRELQKARNILLDHPMTGLNEAIWWIEYVLRHDGARHLRSPAADTSFFQYFMVDVVAFLLTSFYLTIYLLKRIIFTLINLKRSKVKTS